MVDKTALDEALAVVFVSSDPIDSIYVMLRKYLDNGATGKELHDDLMQVVLGLRERGLEKEEDIVLDGMDFLVGWCHKDHSLADRWGDHGE